ncbi:hypothetical protein LPJ59_005801, partial [Coemansia sp. RSA 2399]
MRSIGDSGPPLIAPMPSNPMTLDGQYPVILTPTSSVAVMGLAAMRYGHEGNNMPTTAPIPDVQSSAENSGFAYPSAPGSHQRQQQTHPGMSQSSLNSLPHSQTTSQQQQKYHHQALVDSQARQAALSMSVEMPIATVCTTPAIFVRSSQIQ